MSKTLTLSKTIYSNWNDSVMSYLNGIRKFEILTQEEEIDAFKKIANGTDEEKAAARKKIMECNQRFIYAVAKQYAKGNDIMDLISVGNIGMNEAIDKFSLSEGKRFLTYAVWYIRREIVSYITNNGTMVRTTNKHKLMGILPRVKEKLFQKYGREATPEEIIESLDKDYNIKIKENEDVYDTCISSISDTMIGENDSPSPSQIEFEATTATMNVYEDEMERESNVYLADKLLSVCTQKERGIIKMLYGIGYDNPVSPEDVAEAYGMTKTRVLQLKKNIIKKMQKASVLVR